MDLWPAEVVRASSMMNLTLFHLDGMIMKSSSTSRIHLFLHARNWRRLSLSCCLLFEVECDRKGNALCGLRGPSLICRRTCLPRQPHESPNGPQRIGK
jgi:hypothetical protein